jgi:uncharacterized membrane protein YcgQ (UPF0703/DUF1980 family)
MAGNVPAGLPPDTWVQVLGAASDRVEKDPVNEADVPYVDVQSWQKITPPRRQYE